MFLLIFICISCGRITLNEIIIANNQCQLSFSLHPVVSVCSEEADEVSILWSLFVKLQCETRLRLQSHPQMLSTYTNKKKGFGSHGNWWSFCEGCSCFVCVWVFCSPSRYVGFGQWNTTGTIVSVNVVDWSHLHGVSVLLKKYSTFTEDIY